MTRDRKVLYIASLLFTAVLLGMLFVPRSLIRSIAAAISAAAAVAIFFLIKKRSILSINKQQVLLLTSVSGVLYLVLYYVTGMEFGFHRAGTPFSVASFFSYILPITVIIISTEITRSVLLAQNNKLVSLCAFIACVTSELIIGSGLSGIITFNRFMDLVGLTLLPAIISNVLYHYLSRNYGAYPNIAYRLITALYIYFLPVVPSTPDSLVALANLLVPIAIYLFIKSLYHSKQQGRALEKSAKNKWLSYAITAVAILLMVSLVMLISCQFKYRTIVIATKSMTGELNRGDALIFERYDDQILKEDQIIVFKSDDHLVVHRIVGIERINGQNRYYTKGDANEDRDDGFITDGNIEGVALFKVSYVGYPSIWMRDIFN